MSDLMQPTANNSQQQLNNSLTKVNSQSRQEVDIQDVTNINSKISYLSLKKSGLECRSNNLYSRKAEIEQEIHEKIIDAGIMAIGIIAINAIFVSVPIIFIVIISLPVMDLVYELSKLLFSLREICRIIDKFNEENKPNIEQLDEHIQDLESKKEELESKYPCVREFLNIKSCLDPEIKKYDNNPSKCPSREEYINNIKNIVSNSFLKNLYNEPCNIKNFEFKEEKMDCIYTYKHVIRGTMDDRNNGLCIEIRFFYIDEKSVTDNVLSIVLSKGKEDIAEISK